MSLRRVWMPSPNYSSRGGARVRLIVVHTAEGALTIEALGSFFASLEPPASRAMPAPTTRPARSPNM